MKRNKIFFSICFLFFVSFVVLNKCTLKATSDLAEPSPVVLDIKNYVKTLDNGEAVYTTSSIADHRIECTGDVSKLNTFEYKLKYWDAYDDAAVVAVQLKSNTNNRYLSFDIYPNVNSNTPVAILRLTGTGNLARVELGENGGPNKEITVKVVVGEKVEYYVNGNTIYSEENAYGKETFWDSEVYIWSYNLYSEIRDVKIYDVATGAINAVDTVEVKEPEKPTEPSPVVLDIKNYVKTLDNGEAVYTTSSIADHRIECTGDVSKLNTFEYKLKYWDAYDDAAVVAVQLKSNTNNRYLSFDIYPNVNSNTPVAILRLTGTGNLARVELGENGGPNKEITVKVVVGEKVEYYVNGNTIYSEENAYGKETFWDSEVYIWSYNLYSEIRDVKIYDVATGAINAVDTVEVKEPEEPVEPTEPSPVVLDIKNYVKTLDNGEAVYTTSSIADHRIECTGDVSKLNTFEYKLKYWDAYDDAAVVAVQLKSNTNNRYLSFDIYPNVNSNTPVAILRLTGTGNLARVELGENGGPNKEITVKVVVGEKVEYYVNGNTIYSEENAYGKETFWDSEVYIWSYNLYSEIRDVKIYDVATGAINAVDTVEVKEPDSDNELWACKSIYEQTGEGIDAIYTCDDIYSAVVEYMGDKKNINTFEADVKFTDAAADDAQIDLQINTDNSYYLFCIYAKTKSLIVRFGDSQLYKTGYESGDFGKIDVDTWVHVKAVLEENFIEFYVNDILVYSSLSTCNQNLWTRALVCSWKLKNQVKNLALSYTKVEKPVIETEWIADSNWVVTNEGDNQVYTTNKGGSSIIKYNKEISDEINTIEADINFGKSFAGDGQVGLQVNTETSYYYIDLAPNTPEYPVSRVFYGNNRLIRNDLTTGKWGDIKSGNWTHVKFIVDDNYIVGYINEEIAFKKFSTNEELWTKVAIFTWQCEASVKNIELSHTDKDYASIGYLDFEFNDEGSVASFKTENATINNKDGKMIITLEDGKSIITSPYIDVQLGDKYSMNLSVRNTILIHLMNNSTATKAKIYYTTDEDSDYSEDKSKEFEIGDQNETYQPFYINLSDTIGCSGHLKTFRIVIDEGNTGTISIDAITFEREDKIYNYAGSIESCIADKETRIVTIKGNVQKKYANKKVWIYATGTHNYSESLTFDFIDKIASGDTDANGNFIITFPLDYKGQTLLAYPLLASVSNVKISQSFLIENYQDFSDQTERFIANKENTFDVSLYGAKGDAITDDTKAIQDTIDHVASLGGGIVVLSGDDSLYGKRYVATHIKLASNIEFRIEKGAVLWQSQRESDYSYKPTYGHDVDIDGLMWCHAGATVNYPLLLIKECENVRITGDGTIRMMDVGGESDDFLCYHDNPSLNPACSNRIHAIPIVTYHSKHIDITNITIRRSNIWHCYMSFNNDVYVGNIKEKEIGCATSDGFTITSNKNLVLDRCLTYTSDDSIGICTCYDDPRGFLYRPCRPGEDNACENITIRHCFTWGGFGYSFIPWGTGAPNAYYEEIRNVEIYDCVVGGYKSVGCWPDDPFYGTSKTYTYNNSEDNDYTSVKDVYMHNNRYLNSFEMYYGKVRLPITNFIVTDNDADSAKSPSQFMSGNFDKKIRTGSDYSDESSFVVGLCYWSERVEEGSELGTKIVDDSLGYSGYIKGDGELFQGLYEKSGYYKLTMKVKSEGGKSVLFARDAISGKVLNEVEVDSSNFEEKSLEFNLGYSTTVQVGMRHNGEKLVYIDDASIVRLKDKLLDDYFEENFEDDTELSITYDEEICDIIRNKDGMYLECCDSEDNKGFIMGNNYNSFDFELQFKPGYLLTEKENYIFFKLGDNLELFKLDVTNYKDNQYHLLGVTYNGNTVIVYVDHVKVGTYSSKVGTGAISVYVKNITCAFDNIKCSKVNSLNISGITYSVNVSIDSSMGSYEFISGGATVSNNTKVSIKINANEDKSYKVKINGETVEVIDDIVTFTPDKDSEVVITFDDTITPASPDKPKKGCRSEVNFGSIGAFLIVFVGLIIFNYKRRKEY